MKKGKIGFLRRVIAVLSTAVLIAGTVSNAVPARVLAQDGSGAESVSGNNVEPVEEDTSGTCGDNLTWTLADGVLTISGSGAMENYWYDTSPFPFEKSDIKTIVINEGVTSIGNFVFSSFKGLTGITIPASVTSIGEYAFSWCSSLEEVTILGSMTSIGFRAFNYCSSLEEVTMLGSVTSIEGQAFVNCSSLEKVTIPAGVVSIGWRAFEDCSSLEEITIPASVMNIETRAFSDCSSLTTVTMLGETPPTVGTSAFTNFVFEDCKFVTEDKKGIHVPMGAKQAYQNAWIRWASYVTEVRNVDNSEGVKDDEPETGDSAPLELCVALAMIAGFTYLLLYFTNRECA